MSGKYVLNFHSDVIGQKSSQLIATAVKKGPVSSLIQLATSSGYNNERETEEQE